MKALYPIALFLIACSTWAQSNSANQPLSQVQQFLQLSDAQVQSILTNNDDYDQFALSKQIRISQLQTEIATETAKDTLDPLALGTRYAEIETICREMKNQASTYQTKNTDLLTDQQKANLQLLQDALKLSLVISDAQTGNLIGTPGYAPLFFTSTTTSTGSSSFGIGVAVAPASGCYSPFVTAVIRTGDFGSTVNWSVLPPNQVLGSTPPRSQPPTHWFNATQHTTPKGTVK